MENMELTDPIDIKQKLTLKNSKDPVNKAIIDSLYKNYALPGNNTLPRSLSAKRLYYIKVALHAGFKNPDIAKRFDLDVFAHQIQLYIDLEEIVFYFIPNSPKLNAVKRSVGSTIFKTSTMLYQELKKLDKEQKKLKERTQIPKASSHGRRRDSTHFKNDMSLTNRGSRPSLFMHTKDYFFEKI
jgi:hypothetical protein